MSLLSVYSSPADGGVVLNSVPSTGGEDAMKKHQRRNKGHQRTAAPASSGTPRKEKILAERFKTQMCRNYERKGSCPYENKCMFAHGDADLRTPEMNVRDGLFTEESIEAFRRAQRLLKKRANQQAARLAAAAAAGEANRPADHSSEGVGSSVTAPPATACTLSTNDYVFATVARPSFYDSAKKELVTEQHHSLSTSTVTTVGPNASTSANDESRVSDMPPKQHDEDEEQQRSSSTLSTSSRSRGSANSSGVFRHNPYNTSTVVASSSVPQPPPPSIPHS